MVKQKKAPMLSHLEVTLKKKDYCCFEIVCFIEFVTKKYRKKTLLVKIAVGFQFRRITNDVSGCRLITEKRKVVEL